ncbi:hypothetical protein [Labilibaculum sp.]|uniref:hypothetical protein n=1 Tax=Labilibaculum sp. TaxID=2060723 RepID=UPI003563253E
MKIRLQILFVCIFLLIEFCPSLYAQALLSTDSENIINGKLWVPNYSIAQGEQLFLSQLELNGDLRFKGKDFKNQKFFYDITKDEIIIAIPTEDNTSRNIVLNPYFLEGFTVLEREQNYHFMRGNFIHDELQQNAYYQIFNSESLRYVVKHSKARMLNSKNASKTFKYVDNSRMYIIKKQQLSKIKKTKDILNFFPQQKKEIRRFIRTHKLKINKHTPLDALPILTKFDL